MGIKGTLRTGKKSIVRIPLILGLSVFIMASVFLSIEAIGPPNPLPFFILQKRPTNAPATPCSGSSTVLNFYDDDTALCFSGATSSSATVVSNLTSVEEMGDIQNVRIGVKLNSSGSRNNDNYFIEYRTDPGDGLCGLVQPAGPWVVITSNQFPGSPLTWYNVSNSTPWSWYNVSNICWRIEYARAAGDDGYTIGVDSIHIDVNFTDTKAPKLVLDSPSNATYYQRWVWANLSVSDLAPDSGWYSLDGGANISLTKEGSKFYANVSASLGGHTIRLYANDTSGNENTTSVSFTAIEATLVVNLTDPSPITCTSGSPCAKGNYSLFTANATVRCVTDPPGQSCGSVSGSIRYNSSGSTMDLISATKGITPFSLYTGQEFINDSAFDLFPQQVVDCSGDDCRANATIDGWDFHGFKLNGARASIVYSNTTVSADSPSKPLQLWAYGDGVVTGRGKANAYYNIPTTAFSNVTSFNLTFRAYPDDTGHLFSTWDRTAAYFGLFIDTNGDGIVNSTWDLGVPAGSSDTDPCDGSTDEFVLFRFADTNASAAPGDGFCSKVQAILGTEASWQTFSRNMSSDWFSKYGRYPSSATGKMQVVFWAYMEVNFNDIGYLLAVDNVSLGKVLNR